MPRRQPSSEPEEAEAQRQAKKQRKHEKYQKLKADFTALQEQNRDLLENNRELLEEVEALRRESREPGEDRQDEQHVEENTRVSKEEIKYWKKIAQVSGRRAGVLYAPFLKSEPLADHRIQARMGDILNEVQQAKESDNELEDDDNPAIFWDSPHFDIPDPIDITRELIYNLPRSPGMHWLDEWFQDAFALGVRKQRGDLVHSVAEYHEKIFDIADPAFEDHEARRQSPEVQDLLRTFLHTTEEDPVDQFFKSDCIVRVLRLLLNGPAAIRTGRRSSKSRKPHVDMWHVKFITPSLLALAATVIKFVLSGEPSFEETSGPTNYTAWYLGRLELLEGFYADESDAYNALIDYYNRQVLPDRYHEEGAGDAGVDHGHVHLDRERMDDEERAFLARVRGEVGN
ncbi:hypothetical protein FRC10_011168 [Ceratobasidium sp. 414]|nr:hypothetical protein FRC10_011168 [Ceratobasidium sp. 414]